MFFVNDNLLVRYSKQDVPAHKYMLFNCLACLSSDLQEMVDVVDHHQLFVKIEKAFPECDEEGCLKIYENVLRCVGNKQYVCYLLFSATINVFLSFLLRYSDTNSIRCRNVKY